MDGLAQRRIRIGIVCAVVAGALWLMITLPLVFNPFLLALALAYILNPLIIKMEARRIPRKTGIALVFLVLSVAVAATGLVLVPSVMREASLWHQQLIGEPFTETNGDAQFTPGVDTYTDINHNGRFDEGFLSRLSYRLRSTSPEENPLRRLLLKVTTPDKADAIQHQIVAGIKTHLLKTSKTLGDWLGSAWSGWLSSIVTGGLRGVNWALNILMLLLLTPIYLAFLLNSLPDGWSVFVSYIPGRLRPRAVAVLEKIDIVLAAFFRGRLLTCTAIGVVTALGFWLCGVPFGLLFGMLIGLLSFIPFLNILGLIPALVSCWMEGFGLGGYALVMVAYSVGQTLDPLIMSVVVGKNLQLSPVTILLSMFACASLFGFLGMLLAVPIVATGKILGQEFLLPHLKALAEEKHDGRIQTPSP